MLASEGPFRLAGGGDGVLGTVGATEEAHPGGMVVELVRLAWGFGRSDDATQVAVVLVGIALPGAQPLAADRVGLGQGSG